MIDLVVIGIALIAIATGVLITLLVVHGFFYVPFVPTERSVIEKMVKLAQLKSGEKVYDLGCGDGRILEEALKQARVQATGIEVSKIIVWIAKGRSLWNKTPIRFIRKNFFEHDLSDADVVFCYLFPGVMQRLQKKFEKELKPGARVLSYSFPMVEWNPVKTLVTREKRPNNFLVYRYDIPESYRKDSS